MNKTIRKLRPSDYWRIGEHESWFSDMAEKGLHLKKMGIHFAHFTKGDPKKMRYRIDVSIKRKMTPEQIRMYAESGWDYVTGNNYFHVFSSPKSSGAPELHTDPAEQSYTLKELDKKLANSAGMTALAVILMMAMQLSFWFLDRTPIFVLIEGIAIQQTILTLFFGYSVFTSLRAAISIRALRKGLAEGKPIDHHASWKKHYRLHSIIAFFFTVVVGLSAIIPFAQLVKSETKTLPEANTDLPIVRLADVEQNPALTRVEDSYISDGVDWGNRYTYKWSPLAPVQFETDESGIVPGEMWKDGSGEYSPSIQTRFYELSVPALADELLSDLITRYQYEDRREDFIETKHPELDLLIVHEKEEIKDVFASKDNAVIHVRYFGYGDINLIIENVVEKIDIISE